MTAEEIEMFGEAVPGEAVKPTYFDPLAGYTPHGEKQFVRMPGSGKWRRVDQIRKEEHMMPANTTVERGIQAAHVMTVYDCIVAVSKEMGQEGISKTRNNQQQGYKFRGIDDVFNALSPLLAKHRLVILPRVLSRAVVERATQKGGVLFYVTVEAEFDFVSAADGSTHTVKTYGEAMDSADKATNKAMSAAYKYAAFQTFCIPTEGDNDADAVTHDVRPSFAPVQRSVVQPPALPEKREKPAAATVESRSTSSTPSALDPGFAGDDAARRAPSVPNGGDSGRLSDDGPDLGTAEPNDLPDGFHLIDDYKQDGDWHQVSWGRDAQGGWMVYKTKLAKIGLEAKTAYEAGEPVSLHSKKFPYLDRVERLGITRAQIDGSKFKYVEEPPF